MNALQASVRFIVLEGALLTALFFCVAFLVAWLQQTIGPRLHAALGHTSLETGAMVAATAGAVTPFCSCSTVPVLSGMLRANVRFGVCFTFLIASPVINEGVLLVLLRHFPANHAVAFLALAFLISVALGVGLDRLGLARFVRALPAAPASDAVRMNADTTPRLALAMRARFAARAAWHELRDALPYLLLGMSIGALIYGYVPHETLNKLSSMMPGPVLILAMALIGVPVYVNATMVVPIALALLSKGMGAGPVAAFLVSAAGTSIPEMILLTKLFRLPLVLAHMVSIVLAATLIGLGMAWISS
jgi:uncharacterized membrane protein YraQ (UPF0718 family)